MLVRENESKHDKRQVFEALTTEIDGDINPIIIAKAQLNEIKRLLLEIESNPDHLLHQLGETPGSGKKHPAFFKLNLAFEVVFTFIAGFLGVNMILNLFFPTLNYIISMGVSSLLCAIDSAVYGFLISPILAKKYYFPSALTVNNDSSLIDIYIQQLTLVKNLNRYFNENKGSESPGARNVTEPLIPIISLLNSHIKTINMGLEKETTIMKNIFKILFIGVFAALSIAGGCFLLTSFIKAIGFGLIISSPLGMVGVFILSVLWTIAKAETRVPAIIEIIDSRKCKHDIFTKELEAFKGSEVTLSERHMTSKSPASIKNDPKLGILEEIKEEINTTRDPNIYSVYAILSHHDRHGDEDATEKISNLWKKRKAVKQAIGTYKSSQSYFNLYGINRADELQREVDNSLVMEMLTHSSPKSIDSTLSSFIATKKMPSDLKKLSIFRSLSRCSSRLTSHISDIFNSNKEFKMSSK